MINPANYYNPFAKYNYVSKTRGVYFPKENVSGINEAPAKISTNICSENYSAEADIIQAINADNGDNSLNDKLLGLLNKLFPDA